jgi:3-oxoacyl-[acyl-carrier protein] reductase
MPQTSHARRNVLVTGGSRGIGLGISRTLALAGFRVVALARTEGDALATAQAELAAQGIDALHFQPYDLSNVGEMAGLVKQLSREYGHFYGLVNNAGIGTAGLLSHMPDRDIEKLLSLNVLSPVTLTKYVLRSIMSAGGLGGRIVNISSVVATTGYTGLSAYSASKAALLGFTRSLAREVGPLGITVNAVSPGFIDTEMTHDLTQAERQKIARRSALRRMAEVSDVAHAVEFLLSEKARNITGTVTTVDAGNTV